MSLGLLPNSRLKAPAKARSIGKAKIFGERRNRLGIGGSSKDGVSPEQPLAPDKLRYSPALLEQPRGWSGTCRQAGIKLWTQCRSRQVADNLPHALNAAEIDLPGGNFDTLSRSRDHRCDHRLGRVPLG